MTPSECVGKRPDPALPEVVDRTQRDDVEDRTILEEVRKGFTLKGTLSRPVQANRLKVNLETSC